MVSLGARRSDTPGCATPGATLPAPPGLPAGHTPYLTAAAIRCETVWKRLPWPNLLGSFGPGVPANRSPRFLEFGGESRGIGKAEVLQFETRSHQMVLVDLLAVAIRRQHND